MDSQRSLFLLGTLGTFIRNYIEEDLKEVSIPLRYIRHQVTIAIWYKAKGSLFLLGTLGTGRNNMTGKYAGKVSIPLRYIRHEIS